jgi:hypothetical protein
VDHRAGLDTYKNKNGPLFPSGTEPRFFCFLARSLYTYYDKG